MKQFTVIIPTWNMGRYLPSLLHSILDSPFADQIEEVLFVCEKSTDGSEEVISKLAHHQGDKIPRVSVIQPEQRRGLFMARYLGAAAARTDKIFFIDSRIILPKLSGSALPELTKKYDAMCANVDIDEKKNLFCLYWQRSHETIFKRTYLANKGINKVTSENYDQYRIGGTCFYCSRNIFVELSEKYLRSPLISDDTYLLRDLVAREPIFVHPAFRINWEPRDTWKSFLKHLYVRGPGFAEYHIFEQRGWLFYTVLLGTVYLALTAAFVFVNPLVAVSLISFALMTILLSTVLFAKSPGEFIRLAPLHLGVVLSYGSGALKGIWVIWKKRQAASIDKNNTTSETFKSNRNVS